MEAEQERRWQQARTPARPAFDMAKWKQQDYAESARWEQQQAYQRYRQGERADPQPATSSQNSLSKALDTVVGLSIAAVCNYLPCE